MARCWQGSLRSRAVVQDPRFAQVLRTTLELWQFSEWDVLDRIQLYPMAVRSAAGVVRNWRGEEVGQRSAGVVAAAEAVAMQRPRDAQVLVANRSEMAELIKVQSARVILKRPEEFAEEARRR